MTHTVTPEVTDTPTGELPYNAATHSCGAWWTGLTRAHCPSCHRTFSTDSAANKHRVGRFGIDRRCVDPATVGLIAVDKPYGVLWQHPGPEDGRDTRRFAKPARPDSYIAQEAGGCDTCGYDWEPGEEIGDVNGEINCVGCFDRAVEAGTI